MARLKYRLRLKEFWPFLCGFISLDQTDNIQLPYGRTDKDYSLIFFSFLRLENAGLYSKLAVL